jgi:hypothetical protein
MGKLTEFARFFKTNYQGTIVFAELFPGLSPRCGQGVGWAALKYKTQGESSAKNLTDKHNFRQYLGTPVQAGNCVLSSSAIFLCRKVAGNFAASE